MAKKILNQNNITLEDLEMVVGLDEIASECGVDKKVIYGWIDRYKNQFPARFSRGEWLSYKNDLKEWVDNGCKPKLDTSFTKDVGLDIIATFAEYEVGKNCMPATSYRMPLVWKPKLDEHLSKYPQLGGRISNFIRAAVWNLLNDLDTLSSINAMGTDPAFSGIALLVKEKEMIGRMTKFHDELKVFVGSITKSGAPVARVTKNIKELHERIVRLEEPWKTRGEKLIKKAHEELEKLKLNERLKSSRDEAGDSDEEDDEENNSGY